MSFVPFFSLSTIPYAARWTLGLDLAMALFTVLALIFAERKPHLRRDVFLIAGGALAMAVASVA